MHNGSLSFIPLAKRKKLITLNFSHAHHCHGDECAKHFHVFVQTVHATRHPFHVLGFGVIFCHSTIPPLRLLGLPSITHAHLDNSDFPSFLNCFKPFWSTSQHWSTKLTKNFFHMKHEITSEQPIQSEILLQAGH